MKDDLISRKAAIDALTKCHEKCCRTDDCGDEWIHYETIQNEIECIPSAQSAFDITVKIDKAYDDGYEAGYLQGRHDWGDFDE